LRALLDGLFAGPERSEELRERLRERAAKKGSQHLHNVLNRLDATAAQKIHPNDTPKLIRAVEVCLASRRPMSEQWQEGRDALAGFRVLRIGLNPARPELYARINQRVVKMFEHGLIEETRILLQRYGQAARPLSSIGYSQVAQLLKGDLTESETIAAVQQAHRNYAKRQMTWFRREPEMNWVAGFGDEAKVQEQALQLVSGEL
jgi:tRNA dimethylallyltransferase